MSSQFETVSLTITVMALLAMVGSACDRRSRPKGCPDCPAAIECPTPEPPKPCELTPDPLEPVWAAECISNVSASTGGIDIDDIEKCAEIAAWLYRGCEVDL